MFVVTTVVLSRTPSFKAIAAPQILLEYDSRPFMSPHPELADPVLATYRKVGEMFISHFPPFVVTTSVVPLHPPYPRLHWRPSNPKRVNTSLQNL